MDCQVVFTRSFSADSGTVLIHSDTGFGGYTNPTIGQTTPVHPEDVETEPCVKVNTNLNNSSLPLNRALIDYEDVTAASHKATSSNHDYEAVCDSENISKNAGTALPLKKKKIKWSTIQVACTVLILALSLSVFICVLVLPPSQRKYEGKEKVEEGEEEEEEEGQQQHQEYEKEEEAISSNKPLTARRTGNSEDLKKLPAHLWSIVSAKKNLYPPAIFPETEEDGFASLIPDKKESLLLSHDEAQPWEHVRGVDIVSTGMRILHCGYYFLYSSIKVSPDNSTQCQNFEAQRWSHMVFRQSPGRPDYSALLLRSVHTCCNSCEGVDTSFTGGIFFLRTDDFLHVEASGQGLINLSPQSSYLGVTMMGSRNSETVGE